MKIETQLITLGAILALAAAGCGKSKNAGKRG
jgi:hypothetical protein